jgi:hypothetical protein
MSRFGVARVARRTLGILLLLVTVVLWTGSNFLASVCTLLLGAYQSISNNFGSPSLLMTPTLNPTS